jgi:hypothetical protein
VSIGPRAYNQSDRQPDSGSDQDRHFSNAVEPEGHVHGEPGSDEGSGQDAPKSLQSCLLVCASGPAAARQGRCAEAMTTGDLGRPADSMMRLAPARRTEPMAPSYRYTPGARTDRRKCRPGRCR